MSSNHKMIIITAPSGSGKTTIARHVLEETPQLTFSVSATNRPMRDYEKSGVHYFFFSDDEFQQLVEEDKLAEWEEVYPGRFYGTLKSEIQRAWDSGKSLLFDIDVHGALTLKELYGDNALVIFVKAPSVRELEARLRSRGSESEASLKTRIDRATYEYSLQDEFDKILVNDNLEEAVKEALLIVNAYLKGTESLKNA